MVTSVPSDYHYYNYNADATETGSGATTSGGITYFQYYHVGPAEQLGVFGWGISQWGGTVTGSTNNNFKRSIKCMTLLELVDQELQKLH